MEIAKVKPDLQIEFPLTARNWLSAETELAVFVGRDTLILKKIKIPKLSTIAERATENEMTLDEIVAEVHQYRKEKREKQEQCQ